MENLFRIIGYSLLLILDLLLYLFLHSHFTFMVLVLMLAAPFVSLVCTFILKKRINVDVICCGGNVYGRQGEEIFFRLIVKNTTPFVSLDTKVHLKIANTFLKSAGEQIIEIPVRAFNGYSVDIPVIAQLPGIISLSAVRIDVKDLMGFHFFRVNCDAKKEIVTLPRELEEEPGDMPGLDAGMLESEESTKRGNDFSDVQEIREYIPGDRLMSIHWKLSAKRDILMVKDRVSMSDRQMVILPELCGNDPLILTQIVVAAYSVICSLVRDKTTVRLLYWSRNRFEYEDIRLDYIEDVDNGFAKMFYEDTYDEYDLGASYMANVYPEIKAYVHVTGDGGKVSVTVRENN